jgi:hypothetical protein
MIFGSGDNSNPYWQPRLDICYTEPTGISDLINSENGVFISPNPSDGIFMVSMNKNSFNKISVYDETGRIVFNESLAIGMQYKAINLSDVAPGIYMVKLTGEKKPFIQKIVKN